LGILNTVLKIEKRGVMRKTGLLVFSVILISGFLLIFAFGTVRKGITQPIRFNHKIHAENDLECLDCHTHFQDRATSGRPGLEICSGCHEEALGESEEEKKVVEHVQAGEEIAWKRLYRVPEDVYYSHRRHVVLGQIECETCHDNIGQSTRPPSRARKISMKKCLNCHKENSVTTDCIACHR
jgi:hypothetical protein